MKDINKDSYYELYNRVRMPVVGYGDAQGRTIDEQVKNYLDAIAAGYRMFDTAFIYHSERALGIAIKESKIPREEFFIVSKMWDPAMRRGEVDMLRQFEESLKRLQTDYIDCYLLHWPVIGKIVDAWKTCEKFYYTGHVRSLGLSNVKRHHFVEIMRNCDVLPHVQEDEFSPWCMSNDVRRFDEFYGIRYISMMPLCRLKYESEDSVLNVIGKKYGKSMYQVVLRWNLQHGVCPLPTSHNSKRMRENLDFFDFELTKEEMDRIDALNFEGPVNWDPDLFDF